MTSARVHLMPLGMCAGLAALVLLFPTNDFTRVDGALRAVEAVAPDGPALHGNNHLLYPFWVRQWIRLVGATGIPVGEPIEVLRATQALNGLLAVAAIAVMYSLFCRLYNSRQAVMAAMLVASSTAFLSHATSSAEPLLGLLPAIIGLRLIVTGGASLTRRLALAAAGVSLALAVASYQAMATVAGLGAVLIAWPHASPVRVRALAADLASTAIGGLLGLVTIYGAAYAAEGVPPGEMAARFLALGGAPEVYSGLSAGRALNVALGLVESSSDALPAGYAGLRAALGDPGLWRAAPRLLLALALWGVVAGLVALGARRALAGRFPALAWGGLLAVGLVLFPLLYWDPLYDKLWLVPLAAFAIAAVMASRPSCLADAQRKALHGAVAALVALQLLSNVPPLIASHFRRTPHLDDARAVASVLRSDDAVVADFDPVSSLWLALYRNGQDSLLLPASNSTEAASWLERSERGSGRLVFISVLDHDRRGWDAFLGRRVGLPYSILDSYRASAQPLLEYQVSGRRLTVRATAPPGGHTVR